MFQHFHFQVIPRIYSFGKNEGWILFMQVQPMPLKFSDYYLTAFHIQPLQFLFSLPFDLARRTCQYALVF